MNNLTQKIEISILIPIYGAEKYIERSLRSLFSQTKTSGVEFVLVNDCTKDRSMEIARELVAEYPDLNVKIIEHEENGGIAVARQSALDAASGEYILYVDSDDWCEPLMLEDLYLAAQRSNADIVVCDYYVSLPRGEFYDKMYVPKTAYESLIGIIRGDVYWVLWNKLVRRKLFDGIDFIPKLNYGEDLLICAQLFANAQSVDYLPKAYLHYVQNQGATTNSINIDKLENLVLVTSEIEQLVKEREYDERLQQVLNFLKMRTKYTLLTSTRGSIQRKYAKYYPEAAGCIMDLNEYPKYERWALLMACRGFLLPFNIIRMIRDYKEKKSTNKKF